MSHAVLAPGKAMLIGEYAVLEGRTSGSGRRQRLCTGGSRWGLALVAVHRSRHP
jgi:hypothetical protein